MSMSSFNDSLELLLLAHQILEAGSSNSVTLSPEDTATAKSLLLSRKATSAKLSGDGYLQHKLEVALAPHKSLPPELLSKIFRHVAAGSPLFYPPHLSVHSFQWALRHVCSLWRQIVISDPIIWRDLSINTNAFDLQSEETPGRRKIDFWQQNIVNICPQLRIFITGGLNGFFSSSSPNHAPGIIQDMILRPNCERITTITTVNLWSPFTFNDPHLIVFPKLKRLCYYEGTIGAITRIESMPNLTSLEVQVPLSPPTAFQMTFVRRLIPWARLTELVICSCNRDACLNAITLVYALRVLRLCCGLKYCTLQVGFSTINPNLPPLSVFLGIVIREDHHQPVHLANLLSLRIYQSFTPECQDIILDFLVAPSLIALEYYSTGQRIVGLSQILPFIRRSKCTNLEDLFLDSERWTVNEDPDAKAIFELTPSLRTFYAPNYLAYSDLIPTMLDTTLLPRIERIGLSNPFITLHFHSKKEFHTTWKEIETRCRLVFYRKRVDHLGEAPQSKKFRSRVMPWKESCQRDINGRIAIFTEFTGMIRGWNDKSDGHFWVDHA